MSGLFGGGPKMPKDRTAEMAEKKKQAQADAKRKLQDSQKKRSKYGRQSTVLTPDEEKKTILG